MDMRELKALELAAKAIIVFQDGAWLVPSQSSNKTYPVTLGTPPSCPCDDFQLRQQPCKHIMAARLVRQRQGGETAPEIVADAVPKRLMYRQNWPVYNLSRSQCNG
jgi:hypothetical protein